MIDPNEPDANFKMMTTPSEWPWGTGLPLKKSDGNHGISVAILVHAFPRKAPKGIYFIDNKNIVDPVTKDDVLRAKFMESDADFRALLADGWVVD